MTRRLTREDRIVWESVASTATPLKGRRPALLMSQVVETGMVIASPPEKTGPSPAVPVARLPRAPAPAAPPRFDLVTRRKLSKGRLAVEAKVDLHGMSQGEAHGLLQAFLHRAYSQGLRHVLVVTGKGASLGSEGILRRAVPVWLATAPFRALVSGYDTAARNHGGSGALYVRLRRHPEGGAT